MGVGPSVGGRVCGLVRVCVWCQFDTLTVFTDATVSCAQMPSPPRDPSAMPIATAGGVRNVGGEDERVIFTYIPHGSVDAEQ